jgi:hypothetical protein
MPYQVETTSRGLELWAKNQQGKNFRVSDNPVDKIQHYKNRINNLYAPLIGQKCDEGGKDYYGLVTAGIIFTRESTDRVQALLNPLLSELERKYIPIIGIDRLNDRQIEIVLPSSKRKSSKYMNEAIARQLRSWLVEPDFAQVQRQPLELNAKQKALATTRTKSGYRRIRGAAGSGKSLVLAARAANLAAEGKHILSVSFNITLWHYLRDLVVRHKVPGARVNNITFMHFHEWCKDIIVAGGLELEYKNLFTGKPQNEELAQILETEIVQIVNQAIDNIEQNIADEQIHCEKFDAILVDEGQDFNLTWWNTLRRLLKSIRITASTLVEKKKGTVSKDSCLYLISLWEILKANWGLFSSEISNKKEFGSNFDKLNEIRNRLAHPQGLTEHPLQEEDRVFVSHMCRVIEKIVKKK